MEALLFVFFFFSLIFCPPFIYLSLVLYLFVAAGLIVCLSWQLPYQIIVMVQHIFPIHPKEKEKKINICILYV